MIGSGISASCQFPILHVDDFTEVMEAHETAVHSVLTISESGEVVADGTVNGVGFSCAGGQEQCHFVMGVNGVQISVYYFLNPNHAECSNTEAGEQALQIRNGDYVRVFGQYFGGGQISTCGDLDYYIEILPSEN